MVILGIPDRINVEVEMAACVRSMGGLPLDDILPAQRNFRNADYWFPDHEVIGELKCLEADWATQFATSAPRMHARWVASGLIPPPTSAHVSLQDLPPHLAMELVEPLRRKLKSGAVQEASKQIKQTKIHLERPQAKGLLLIANEGNLLLDPNSLGAILGNILNSPDYSSIHSVVYFCENESLVTPGGQRMRFWMDFVFPSREPVSRDFLQKLADAWAAQMSQVRGQAVMVDDLGSSLDPLTGSMMVRHQPGS